MEKKRVTIDEEEAYRLIVRLEQCGDDAERSAAMDNYIRCLYETRNEDKEENMREGEPILALWDNTDGEDWARPYKNTATAETRDIEYIKRRIISEIRREVSGQIEYWAELLRKLQGTPRENNGGALNIETETWLMAAMSSMYTEFTSFQVINSWLNVYEQESPPMPRKSPLKYKGSEGECLKHYAKLRHIGLITCTGDEWLTLCGLREGEIKPMAWGSPGRKDKDNTKDFVILLGGFFESELFNRETGWQSYLLKALGFDMKASTIKMAKGRLKWDKAEKERLKYMIK